MNPIGELNQIWPNHEPIFKAIILILTISSSQSIMKLQDIVTFGLLAFGAEGLKLQDYPLYHLDAQTYSMHKTGDAIPISCIKRQIDTGEHIFDPETNEIVYGAFPNCLETNKPLEVEFGVDGIKECTIKMDDELFHLFQLYLHKDVPWTCKLESRKGAGVYIPIDISLRGGVMESHVDLDSNINMIIMSDNTDDEGEIVSGAAWSSSGNTYKVIIGDMVKLRFNINWSNQSKGSIITNVDKELLPQPDGNLLEQSIKVSWIGGLRNKSVFDSIVNTFGLFIITLALGALFGIIASYKRLGRKMQANNDDWINKVE